MFEKIPCFKDAMNIIINGLAMTFTASFTRFVGTQSGPGAFPFFGMFREVSFASSLVILNENF